MCHGMRKFLWRIIIWINLLLQSYRSLLMWYHQKQQSQVHGPGKGGIKCTQVQNTDMNFIKKGFRYIRILLRNRLPDYMSLHFTFHSSLLWANTDWYTWVGFFCCCCFWFLLLQKNATMNVHVCIFWCACAKLP